MDKYYSKLTSRNWPLVSSECQKRIKGAKIFFAGCGLGSNVAVLAARIGFSNFVLADGDSVEVSNLNRQSFEVTDVGENKAIALRNKILRINKKAKVKVIPRFLGVNDKQLFSEESIFIVNTVDFGETFIEITEVGTNNNSIIFIPFNIGFGSALMVFDKRSIRLSEFLGPEVMKVKGNSRFYSEFTKRLKKTIPSKIQKTIQAILASDARRKTTCQLGIASNINASMIVSSMIRILCGKRIARAPKIVLLDIDSIIS